MRLAIAAFFSTAAVWAAACGKTPCASTNVETSDGWCVLPITCPEGTQPSLHHERCELPDGGVAVARESVDAGAQHTTTSGIERAAGSGGNRSPEAGSSGTAGQVGTDWDDADAGMSSVDTSPEMIDAGSERPRCGNGLVEPGEECDGNCPSACPPAQGCLASELQGNAAVCTAKCVPLEITAPTPGDDCCPMGADYATDTDCSPSCGDGVLTAPEKCEPGSTEHPCPSRADCDDRIDCTEDSVTGSAEQCSATCAHTPIMRARAGDGCCPAGANERNDDDCEPICGNGVREGTELCDGADCPTSCDDGKPCTDDELDGSASACNARCTHGNGSTNACGGCRALANPPGSECTATLNSCTSSGRFECDGMDATECSARMPTGSAERCDGDDNDCDGRVDEGVKNTCGGCMPLQAAVGASCFVEGVGCTNQGQYECDGTDALRCDAMPCLCGNGVVDSGESCDVMVPGGNPGSCPVTCNDGDPCTTDRKVGSLCQTSCLFVPMGGTCNPQEPEPELPFRESGTSAD